MSSKVYPHLQNNKLTLGQSNSSTQNKRVSFVYVNNAGSDFTLTAEEVPSWPLLALKIQVSVCVCMCVCECAHVR